MKSLSQLNSFSNESIRYNDESPYSITFDAASPTNQTTTTLEDQPFVAPTGINITSVVSLPGNIEYTIDLSSIAYSATIDWGQIPSFLTPAIAGTNIFQIVGPIDELSWQSIRSPVITTSDQSTNFTYTSTISYPDPTNTENTLTKSWTTSVVVTAVPNISTPSDYAYVKNSIGTIAGAPTILNTVGGTYTIVITPSEPLNVYQLGSMGTGGTSTFNAINKTLTISGTKTEVNSHLASIVFEPATNAYTAFTLEYRLTNPTGLQNIVVQNLTSNSPFEIGVVTYVEDQPFNIGYEILDNSPTATFFTVNVSQISPNPITNPGSFSVDGGAPISEWYAAGSKEHVTGQSVVYTPPVDYTGTITFSVTQSKIDNGVTVPQASNENVNIINVGTNSEIVNMIPRTYLSNAINSIFAVSTPYIDELNLGQNYTITLSSALGKFGNSINNAISSNTYSFTGNISSCNTEFNNMVFVPNRGAQSTGNFTYTQTRNGTQQVNQTLTLTVDNRPLPVTTYTYTGNGNWTPTFLESYYGTMNAVVVGGGGGPARGGGGGGGGGVVEILNQQVSSSTTYPIIVGSGGLIGQDSFTVYQGTTYYTSLGGNGTQSSFFGQTASGGTGGKPGIQYAGAGNTSPALYPGGPDGGNVGSPQIFVGANGTASVYNNMPTVVGGGGAGATANGGSGGNIQTGGGGKLSSITGVYYSGGGGGWSSSSGMGTSGIGSENAGGGGKAGSYFASGVPPSPMASTNGKKGTVIIKIS